ncbi:uncharacterized protein LOC100038599 [Mus musculus]|uniref:Uncharacterized protein n=1 Tax=Mus musculus TaxID=10090 RepID=Q3USI9_MOUSE|nr:uncharacterized protein LOC100038599 [Mus musculus]BAE24342.1 unnamed protein product [Mus musculus]
MSPRLPTARRGRKAGAGSSAPRRRGAAHGVTQPADALHPSFAQQGSFLLQLFRKKAPASCQLVLGSQSNPGASSVLSQGRKDFGKQTKRPGSSQGGICNWCRRPLAAAHAGGGGSSCLCLRGHLSSLWMSLRESHRFFSLLLFLLHLFLVLLGWLFPPGKVRCIISFAKKEEII